MAPSLSSGSGEARPASSQAGRSIRAALRQLDPQDALYKAVKLPGRIKCLASLYTALEAGASANADALHTTARHNADPEAVAAAIEALVKEGVEVDASDIKDATAMHHAALNPNAAAAVAAVRALAAAGADARARDSSGGEPVHAVCGNASAEAIGAIIPALIAAGGSARATDNEGRQPVHVAAITCTAGTIDAAVQSLVAAGGQLSAKCQYRGSPLHWIAFSKNAAEDVQAVVQSLAAAGCSPSATANSAATPLHWVARYSDERLAPALIAALVAEGAAVGCKDADGDEPLHWAIKFNDDDVGAAAAVAAALLAAGADRHALGEDGKPPLALALERQDAAECTQLVQALLGPAAGGMPAADGAGPSSGGGQPQLLRLVAAGITQLANRSKAECPVCLEHVPTMAGPCGHLVCEGCAAQAQVRTQCPVCRKRRRDVFKIYV